MIHGRRNRSNGVLPMHIYYIYVNEKYKRKEKLIMITPLLVALNKTEINKTGNFFFFFPKFFPSFFLLQLLLKLRLDIVIAVGNR